jgi:hypothetical protein
MTTREKPPRSWDIVTFPRFSGGLVKGQVVSLFIGFGAQIIER